MREGLAGAVAALLLLSVGAQWLSSWLRLPSILLLLLFGFLAGPAPALVGLGGPLFDPDALLGQDLLLAAVSLSVGVILFEGGLSLRLAELAEAGRTVWRLISVGLAVTWAVGAVAARLCLGFSWPMAFLLGALLTVTGPTVVIPIIQSIRPRGRVGTILKWEGITIDPVGAVLAVLVYEGLYRGQELEAATAGVLLGVVRTALVGGGIGAVAALLLVKPLRRHWIPDHLHEAVVLATVLAAQAGANALQHEAGLLAVTVMGVLLANQSGLALHRIIEFKESLRVLLIGVLFLVLGARVTQADLAGLSWGTLAFAGALILVARPLAVAAATVGSGLSWRERLFLASLAPRGIVAASVAAVFALDLGASGRPEARLLVPATFAVIAATVALSGLGARPLARALSLAGGDPQGVLIMGAHALARAIAKALAEEGHAVLLVDTNRRNVTEARLAGLPARHGNLLAHELVDRLDLTGIGRLLALTANDEANALAAAHLAPLFGSGAVFQLGLSGRKEQMAAGAVPLHLRGRFLFAEAVGFADLTARFASGARIRKTAMTEQFGYAEFLAEHGGRALPLFLVDGGRLQVFAAGREPRPQPGQTLISLIDPPGPPAGKDAAPPGAGPGR